MKIVVVGSVATLILLTGLFVSQVEAKNDKNDDKGKSKQEYKFDAKHDNYGKNHPKYTFVKHSNYDGKDNRSVPIPGTALLLGGGFAGLVAWRARRRHPRA